MKLLKWIIIFLCLGGIAALVIVYWPKIRECCDRYLACSDQEKPQPGEES